MNESSPTSHPPTVPTHTLLTHQLHPHTHSSPTNCTHTHSSPTNCTHTHTPHPPTAPTHTLLTHQLHPHTHTHSSPTNCTHTHTHTPHPPTVPTHILLTLTSVIASKDPVNGGGGLGVEVQGGGQSLKTALLQTIYKVAEKFMSIFLPPQSELLSNGCGRERWEYRLKSASIWYKKWHPRKIFSNSNNKLLLCRLWSVSRPNILFVNIILGRSVSMSTLSLLI